MKRGITWIVLTCLMVTSLVLASCTTKTTSSGATSPATSTLTTTSTTIKNTTTTTATTPTTTATIGHWWDSLGKPQYGGEMVISIPSTPACFDAWTSQGLYSIEQAWEDRLTGDDWTLDPAVWAYKINWRPSDYIKGSDLAESWEFTDSSTYVIHLRKGVHWQNIPLVNGREFTADDVVWHYDHFFDLGTGMKHTLNAGTWSTYQVLKSVTATNNYTVVFKWTIPNPEFIVEIVQGLATETLMDNREAVEKWGTLEDWHHAVGTGPFILKDLVSGSSVILARNPDYFGHDERYPQNQLPYLNTLKILIIPDQATGLAALRTSKIDFIDGVALKDTLIVQKTNPEILSVTYPSPSTQTIDPRNDVVPFKDIRVREAMQMAIDLPTLAKNYYGGSCSPNPSTITSAAETGWGVQYDQWPQDLKDQYTYNPTAAKKLLADAGYPVIHTNVVADIAGDMDLLQIVKSSFAAVGIDMEIRTMDSTSWTAFVRMGRKQDQLVKSINGSLGQIYEPTRQLQRFLTGFQMNWCVVSDPVWDTFYPKAQAANSIDEIKKILIDADLLCAQQHYCISLLQNNFFALYQPWLKGYNGQAMALSGAGSGPLDIGFYSSRFWIDQDIKKSMGK